MEEEKKTLSDMVQAPRKIDIDGQLHMLAWITADEGKALKLLGGAGTPGPMGIPAYYDGDGGVSDGMDEADASAAADEADAAEADAAFSGQSYSTQPTQGPNTGMGLDDSIASMAAAMAGHTAGTTGYSNVQGSINYSPVGPIGYDPFGYLQNKMNQHARNSLSRGVSPSFSRDAKGNVTSVTGPGGPTSGMPGIGSLLSMIGTNMGFTTTTGYNQDKSKDSGNDGNNDEELLIRQYNPNVQVADYVSSADVYNRNPNQYTLNTSGINSLRKS